jgi:uncharacterized surface protein with fasciclin (FAS1) repeats
MRLSRWGENVLQKKNSIHRMKKSLYIAAAFVSASLFSTSYLSTALAAAEEKTVVAVASESGNFKTLVSAIKAAGLSEKLSGKGPFTVFAPTDEAFAKLPAGTVENLLKPENKQKLTDLLTYHVVPGKVMAADVKTGPVKTVNGKDVELKSENGKVSVGKAQVTKADVEAANGVIHVVDTVLMP